MGKIKLVTNARASELSLEKQERDFLTHRKRNQRKQKLDRFVNSEIKTTFVIK